MEGQRVRGSPEDEAASRPRPAPVPAVRPPDSATTRLLHLQATGGNRMVLRLLSTGHEQAPADDLAESITARLGRGSALPTAVRSETEAGLGRPLGNVRLHTDGAADAMAASLGAEAFTTGNDIFFRQGRYDPGSPRGYHVLVHELTHTLQQRSGPPAPAGLSVSDVHDPDEREARAVAEHVTARRAAPEPVPPRTVVAPSRLQLLGTPLDRPVPASAPKPIAETPGQQRKYTPEQYRQMWEAEQGRSLTPAEKDTIDRGCIGITANNLNGGGDPPLDLAFGTFDQAHKVMTAKNATLDWMRQFPLIGNLLAGDARYVVFAKLFWSNQDPDPARRKRSDPTAFQPDPVTGRVDMTGYEYRRQPGRVNFDYGFWDEASQSFWHANHMDYGDPADPMIVLQSTREKFAKKLIVAGETRYGYRDFDRVIYCVALAENYDPGLAAMSSARP